MSSYSKNTFIVFLDLPANISQKIDSIREKYSSSKISYKAHVTLKQDEDYLISPEKLLKIIAEKLSDQKPIKLKLYNVTYKKSSGGWNIYLPVQSKKLTKLVIKLSQALESYIDPMSPRALLSTKWEQSTKFYSHVSIKGTSKKEKFNELYNNIKKEDFEITFPVALVCDRVVIAQWHNNAWKKIKVVRLKNV